MRLHNLVHSQSTCGGFENRRERKYDYHHSETKYSNTMNNCNKSNGNRHLFSANIFLAPQEESTFATGQKFGRRWRVGSQFSCF